VRADGESARCPFTLPKIGSAKAGRILADCGIARSKTLGGLVAKMRASEQRVVIFGAGTAAMGMPTRSARSSSTMA
jgi:hypothetical protein